MRPRHPRKRLLSRLRGEQPPRVDALDRALFGEIPEVLEPLRRAVPRGEMGWRDLPQPLQRRYVAPDGRARIELFSALDLSATGALEAFADAVRAVAPGASGAVVGTVGLARAIAEALREVLLATDTARAVFWSALTSVASFATLAFASHRGIASLAQLLTSGVLLMLVATLVVLPALLARGAADAPAARGAQD